MGGFGENDGRIWGWLYRQGIFFGARCGGYDLTTTWSLSIGERLQTLD